MTTAQELQGENGAIDTIMANQQNCIAELSALLGERGLSCDPDLMTPWLTDWRGRYTGVACALASPKTAQEVSQIIKICARHNIAIVPQGGNSGMAGGATPDQSGNTIILSLRRMDAVREFHPDSQTISCDAGLILQNLHQIVEEKGLRFPLTLGGKGSATIGGLISTNAGGTQVLRHGTMRAQVLGLEAVLADGSIFDAMNGLKKDNRGFDLKQLLIGSEGTLGVVTGAKLRLIPQIGERVVIWAGLPSIGHARRLLVQLQHKAQAHLEGFEVLPAHCLDSVLDYLPSARAPLTGRHPWHALIELTADTNTGRASLDILSDMAQELLESALADGLIEDATVSANEAQAEAFWLLRDSISPAERAKGPAMQHDISVPVEKMADFVAFAVPKVEEQFPGCRALAFGHLGDGNVHFHVLAPPHAVPGIWEDGEGKAVSRYVYDLVHDWRGSISAEHGIGQLKIEELARLSDPVTLFMMRSIKNALDPHNILNPGKLVPLA